MVRNLDIMIFSYEVKTLKHCCQLYMRVSGKVSHFNVCFGNTLFKNLIK